ncbi:MAG: uracil-xanthine permease family protein [Tissierella sp.]|uniref:uracil-xanthine permease family protein n=1 Tax=Tissierella sp. TaxID=41274 RepID=UPI003F985028
MSDSQDRIKLIYGPDDKPDSLKDTIIYSLQWILIMFYPVVWGYSIVGLGLGFEGNMLGAYMGRVVLMIGVSTLIQAVMGYRLSMISGPNIITSLAIVAAMSVGGREYALLSFNAFIVAGVIVAILGALGLISYIGKVWTPLALGSMVMMVGLSTSFTGMELIASYGATWPFYAGIVLALITGWLSIKGKGILATIPFLVTIVAGYAVFMIGGKFDWSLINNAPTFILPKIFPYGLEMPPIDLIVTMLIVQIFAAVNLYGNVDAYTDIIGTKVDSTREKRYFTVFGLVEGVIAPMFGVAPNVAYGENLGFVLLTRIASKFLIIIASIAFIVLSFFGKVGGLMAAMPQPVAGAVLLGVASTLIGLGADTIKGQGKKFETREIFIVGFSIFLALGVSRLPDEFYNTLPNLVGTLLNNPIIFVIVLVIILEQIVLREDKKPKFEGK